MVSKTVSLLMTVAAAAAATRTIHLTRDNFVVYRGEVGGSATANFISELFTHQNDSELYVYLATPGGSVVAGMQMVQSLQALENAGVKITCISDMAASMGFVLTQYCEHRTATLGSILMQHQMSTGAKGPVEQIRTYMRGLNEYGHSIDEHQASRMNLTYEQFHNLVVNDFWVFGQSAVDYNVVDELVNVVCDFNATETVERIVDTFFGRFSLRFSVCPVTRYPMTVSSIRCNNGTCFDELLPNIDESVFNAISNALYGKLNRVLNAKY